MNYENNKIVEKWIFKELITDFDKFYIENLNIWECKWIYLDEFVTVQDPIYKQNYYVQVVSIEAKESKIFFLAVEFSNTNWGIYLKDDYETKLVKFKS